MERLRRVTQGRLSEIFGSRAIQADKFSRVLGFYRSAKESYENMGPDEKQALLEYANGVNDFINNVNLMGHDSTATLLPPEFYAVGLTNVEPWTPVDTCSIIKLLNFYLSWNWS